MGSGCGDLAGLEDRFSNSHIRVSDSHGANPPTSPNVSGGTWERLEVPHHRPGGPDLVLDDLRSRSTIIRLPPDKRRELLSLASALVPTDLAQTPFVCMAWRAHAMTLPGVVGSCQARRM